MRGLRAAGWWAAGAVAAGSLGVALIAALLPAGHVPQAIGGATYAAVARGPIRYLVVTSLRTGGAESAAGLHVGDEIAAVDGIAMPSPAVLRHEVASGHPVALTLRRDGDAVALTLLGGTRETRFDQGSADRRR